MREIKFRAWDCLKKEMITNPEELHSNCFNETDNGFHCGYMADDWNSCDLMQYAGVKDCNFVEIYEGDIVKVTIDEEEFKAQEIVFDDGAFSINIPADNHCPCLYYADEIEIIGNIHQNPELLK